LVDGKLTDAATVDCHIQQSAGGQVDVVDKHSQTATVVAVFFLAILGSPTRRHPVDGRAREGSIKPEVITQVAHEAAQRVGGQSGPDNRTYQCRQEHSEPAISIKVT
jgi:hypothetical protein